MAEGLIYTTSIRALLCIFGMSMYLFVNNANFLCDLQVFRYNLIVPFGRQMNGLNWEKEIANLHGG